MKPPTFTRSSRHFLGIIALVLAGFSFPDPVEGAVRIWTGKAGQFWSTAGNWTNNILPNVGDIIEFPENANTRITINDLNLSLAGIILKGKNYVLAGNGIALAGGIISTPHNSTNRILLDVQLNGPTTFNNLGYFNQLDLAGRFFVNHDPLILQTSSAILLSGSIIATNSAGVVKRDPGILTFGPDSRVRGSLLIEQGTVRLGGGSVLPDNPHIDGELIIGDDFNPSGHARVFWQDSNLLSVNTHVTVHRSGIMNLADMAPPIGITEWIRTLAGSGIVELGPNHLIVNPRGFHPEFSGEIRGSGTLQLGVIPDPPGQPRFGGSLTLSGHSPLTGPVNVDLGHLHLTGSLSDVAITLKAGSELSGNGTARSLVSTAGIIRPGPGTLRFLDHCVLDWWTQLWVPLDGPNAARLKTSSLEINSAFLGASYHGDPADTFTLIEAGSASTYPLRVDGRDLPEGAWIVAGPEDDLNDFQISYTGNGGHNVVLQKLGPYVPPVLRIQRVSATEHRIEWPLGAHTYRLQQTASFFPRFWSTNGLPAAATNDTDFFIIENLSGQERYYRLWR